MVDINHHALKSTTKFVGPRVLCNARNLVDCSGAELPLGLWLEYSHNERDWRGYDYVGCSDRVCASDDAGCRSHGFRSDRHDESSQSGGDLRSLRREESTGSSPPSVSSIGWPDERRANSCPRNY